MFSGMDPASSTTSAMAARRSGGTLAPTAATATPKVTTWHATTTIEATTTRTNAPGDPTPAESSSSSRLTALLTRTLRCGRCERCEDEHREADAERREQVSLELQTEAREDDDRERDLHQLPHGALDDDGASGLRDVSRVASLREGTLDVTDHAAGKHRVEELRPVVHSDGLGEAEAHPESPRDDAPAPGRRGRGGGGKRERGGDHAEIDAEQAVQERPGADMGDDRDQHADAHEQACGEAEPPR